MRPTRILASLLLVTVLSVSGCALMRGESSTGSSSDSSSGVPLEHVRISVLDLIDIVPLMLAINEGYFKEEGLAVDITTSQKGSQSVDKVIAKEVDLGLTSYPPAITAHDKIHKLRVVVDAVTTRPNSILVLVNKDSPIKTVEDLKGKKIANSSKKGISEFAFNSHLRTHGIEPSQVNYVSMPIPDMPANVKLGNVDAAIVAEPYVQTAYKEGLTKLYDPMSEQTADFPWSGYVATEEYAEGHRQTVGKIRRALNKGALLAINDARKAEDILVNDVKVDRKIAPLVTEPVYPISVDPVRLQRVVELMRANGETGKDGQLIDVDMHTMMVAAS